MAFKIRFSKLWFCCGVACGVLIWFCWGVRSFLRSLDLGSNPPGEAFAKIFHISPPQNIDDIKIAGVAHLSGEAWMRLHMNDVDAVLRNLKYKARGVVGPSKDLLERMFPPAPYSLEYLRAVGWEDMKQVKHPEYYAFPQNFNGTGWSGVIVVDRQRQLMFVEAQLY